MTDWGEILNRLRLIKHEKEMLQKRVLQHLLLWIEVWKEGLGFCSVPTLGFEGKFVAIARDELCAFGNSGDVTDDFDIGKCFHTLMVGERHGEEEFVVLTTIEGAGGDIEVELLGCNCRLVVDGQAFLKDATTHLTFVADVEKFAADAIAHINHCGGADASLTEAFDHIAACLGFE